MNAPGPRPAPEINLDEFERRLRAAGTQQGAREDPLAELAKLVEASKRPSASATGRREIKAESPQAPEAGEGLRPALDELDGGPDPGAAGEPASPQFEIEPEPVPVPPEAGRRTRKLAAPALALAGVAMIGAVLALRGGIHVHPKAVPFIAAAEGPTKVQPPSEDNVASTSDSGASLLKDDGKTAVKVVTSEEQPVDLIAQTSANAASQPSSPLPQPSPAQAAAANAASSSPLQQTTNTPVVVAAAPPPSAPQFPDPKPVRTVSLRPDGTPIPTPAPAPAVAADATQAAAPPSQTPAPPAKPAARSASEAAAANAQPSTPKLELPTKLSSKSSARVAVPKTETTAPSDAANEPAAAGAHAKPAKPLKTQIASAEPAAPAAPAAPVDATAASGGWEVQLAAPKSEAEAKSEIDRLNAKYASALNGSTIGVHKAVVRGETIYRLRVVGLSKADAANLCARLKGDGGNCFIAK